MKRSLSGSSLKSPSLSAQSLLVESCSIHDPFWKGHIYAFSRVLELLDPFCSEVFSVLYPDEWATCVKRAFARFRLALEDLPRGQAATLQSLAVDTRMRYAEACRIWWDHQRERQRRGAT
jgi:hypothetical protein